MAGSAGGSEGVEVNLTPLLDLVLQLIMFFMITIRLAHYERSNEEIDLPHAQLTLPVEDEKKKNRFPVWVNVDYEGKIVGLYVKNRLGKLDLVETKVPIKKHREDEAYAKNREFITEKIKAYFDDKKTEYDRQARQMGIADGEWKVGVVIRADRRCRYEQVWTLMDLVREANFDFWQLSIMNVGS